MFYFDSMTLHIYVLLYMFVLVISLPLLVVCVTIAYSKYEGKIHDTLILVLN